MKQIISILLSILGLGLGFLGIVFLIASQSSTSRLILGVLFLIFSGGCIYTSIKLFSSLKEKNHSFQGEIIMKQCPFCKNDYPVNQDIETCPSCGGDLKIYKTKVSNLDERYNL